MAKHYMASQHWWTWLEFTSRSETKFCDETCPEMCP